MKICYRNEIDNNEICTVYELFSTVNNYKFMKMTYSIKYENQF